MCRTAAAGGVEVAAHTHERTCSCCYAALCMRDKTWAVKWHMQPIFLHACVIRLSLGKLWVNQLQVVKRTNTPLKSLTNGVVGRTMGFWVVGSIPTIHNNKLFRFSHVELEKYSSWYPQGMKRLG